MSNSNPQLHRGLLRLGHDPEDLRDLPRAQAAKHHLIGQHRRIGRLFYGPQYHSAGQPGCGIAAVGAGTRGDDDLRAPQPDGAHQLGFQSSQRMTVVGPIPKLDHPIRIHLQFLRPERESPGPLRSRATRSQHGLA